MLRGGRDGGAKWRRPGVLATEGQKDLKVKKGDKVTVYYMMIARKVEMK